MAAAHESDDGPALRDRVAEEVRALLARRRMSGAELARRLGHSQTFIARRLDGRQAMDIDNLEEIARVLDVPVSSFFPDDRITRRNPRPNRPVLALIPGGRSDNTAGQARSTAAPQHAATSTPRPAAVS